MLFDRSISALPGVGFEHHFRVLNSTGCMLGQGQACPALRSDFVRPYQQPQCKNTPFRFQELLKEAGREYTHVTFGQKDPRFYMRTYLRLVAHALRISRVSWTGRIADPPLRCEANSTRAPSRIGAASKFVRSFGVMCVVISGHSLVISDHPRETRDHREGGPIVLLKTALCVASYVRYIGLPNLPNIFYLSIIY